MTPQFGIKTPHSKCYFTSDFISDFMSDGLSRGANPFVNSFQHNMFREAPSSYWDPNKHFLFDL